MPMPTTTTTTERTDGQFRYLQKWFSEFESKGTPSRLESSIKLNDEIHLAITEYSSEYASTICDHLFTLYRHVQHRPFVLQFLPSFIIAYYDVLYHHHHQHHHYHHRRRHPESVDVKTKDVYSTIDTFLVSLYNLGVSDFGSDQTKDHIRIPNLTQASIYHFPNSDYYTPVPFTKDVITKHENKPDVIRPYPFVPINPINASTREPIIWFLLIQYGKNVSLMDNRSRLAFIQMCTKLLGQGFSFDQTEEYSMKSSNGRRIPVSSRIMSEMLGTLIYYKTLSNDEEVNHCMRLLKHRAEYELYADVILMTESLGSLHEFEDQRDSMGISLEIPPTIEMVQQKRMATTTRSIRNRQQSIQQADRDENGSVDISIDSFETQETTPTQRQRTVLNRVNDNSFPTVESKHSHRIEMSPMIDEARTYIASSIGPARGSPSPIVTHRHKTKHVQSLPATSPILPLQSVRSRDEIDDVIPTVIFNENKIRDAENDEEETYF